MSLTLLNALSGPDSTGTGHQKQYLHLGQTFLGSVRLGSFRGYQGQGAIFVLVFSTNPLAVGLVWFLRFAGSRCPLPLGSMVTHTAQQQEPSPEFKWPHVTMSPWPCSGRQEMWWPSNSGICSGSDLSSENSRWPYQCLWHTLRGGIPGQRFLQATVV